ncbi:glyoxalase/bleomycin resistance/dioxygenase family protein [Bacillus sp. Xin]|uniref:ArsI/CadI family heavy metal resistance metalloenzyme n=1 Tax=unclassified Bacillus (in: firmicutes) TaxID=185979 RepID=UPI001574696F|nr:MULTISPECIES: ArsI/CadI family heavy metal resistance metalloenzyme [unclassified Bacillus (in: firmicutes)]MBC6972404.1 glyoxalase/bleomycin resistance/dioxygenase family protein [Bacillus sp. Xin]NSW38393.1 glyoxalase/bleomycin resistance/dioxygenase family protein [Bacillus sp. Xin1]
MQYVHVGINVTNLEKSIEFYSKVFGVTPVKVKEDYAKFLLESPGLNFTLNVRDEVKGSQVNHFGFQVENQEEIIMHKERLDKEGFFAREEMDTTCCYAVQDKFWVTDPDGNEWEFFYTKADSEIHKIETSCVSSDEKNINSTSCC